MSYKRQVHHLDQMNTDDHEEFFGGAAHLSLEEFLVSSLIGRPDLAADIEAAVQPEHFLDHFLSRAFSFVRKSALQGRKVTAASLDSVMKLHPWYADRGGFQAIKDLVTDGEGYFSLGTLTGDSLLFCARSIADAYLRREVIITARDVQAMAREHNEMSGEDLMQRLESRVLMARVATGSAELLSFSDVLDRMDAGPKERTGLLKTGFAKLDAITGGHESGELVLIGGRPGMGKSALAGCIELNIAEQGIGVVSLNGEMNVEQMARRKITDWLHRRHDKGAPTYAQMRRGELELGHAGMIEKARDALRPLPIRMMKRTGMNLSLVRSLLKRQKSAWANQGIRMGAAFIDHVGLLRAEGNSRSRYEAQTEISMAMKEIGDEVGCVMFGLAQLGRDIEKREDKRPQLPDFRDSGSWEQDADVVMAVYRDAYYAYQEKRPTKEADVLEWEIRRANRTLEARLLKVREGQANQTAELWADMARNAIRDDEPPINFDFE